MKFNNGKFLCAAGSRRRSLYAVSTDVFIKESQETASIAAIYVWHKRMKHTHNEAKSYEADELEIT